MPGPKSWGFAMLTPGALTKCATSFPAQFFVDYREMLDKLDNQIDGVSISVPDHWHAAMAIEVLKRGKHVQCEKPLAQTFGEVDTMIEAARQAKLVNQAMNQGHAFDTIRTFREWVEAGLIGEVHEVHLWAPASYSFMDKLDELKKQHPVPPELDWERWQGPWPRTAATAHSICRVVGVSGPTTDAALWATGPAI